MNQENVLSGKMSEERSGSSEESFAASEERSGSSEESFTSSEESFRNPCRPSIQKASRPREALRNTTWMNQGNNLGGKASEESLSPSEESFAASEESLSPSEESFTSSEESFRNTRPPIKKSFPPAGSFPLTHSATPIGSSTITWMSAVRPVSPRVPVTT